MGILQPLVRKFKFLANFPCIVLGLLFFVLSGCSDGSSSGTNNGSSIETNKLSPEPFEELFGRTRDEPQPLVTTQHIDTPDLTFVVMTDTHLGYPGQDNQSTHQWRVEEAIRQINALSPDFVVLVGDIVTSLPYKEEFESQCQNAVAVLSGLSSPLHFVPGNHDIGNQRNMYAWSEDKLLKRGIEREDMLFQPAYRDTYQHFFGKEYYSFDAGSYRFIIFNNQLCNSGYAAEEEQMQWLQTQLETAPSDGVFVFMHNPLFWNRVDEPGPENYETVLEPARSRLLEMLSHYQASAVYTGHTHIGFANTYQSIRMRNINSTTFTRYFGAIKWNLEPRAVNYDPYKLGYLVVRLRGDSIHESWVPLYRNYPDYPEGWKALLGSRLISLAPSEVSDSVLGVYAVPPKPVSTVHGTRELVVDQMWRLAEDLGSKWLQVAYLPEDVGGWDDLSRGLTLGRPQGVNIAVPIPLGENEMVAAWTKIQQHSANIAAVIVENGRWADTNGLLPSWQTDGDSLIWANACARARDLTPDHVRVVLGHVPLIDNADLVQLEETAISLEGIADVLSVWIDLSGPPENGILVLIASAASITQRHGLDLWINASGWQNVNESLRTAYFLRLLAWCQGHRVHVFWRTVLDDNGGMLDTYYDPTSLFHAAQTWQAIADWPAEAAEVSSGSVMTLHWRGVSGRDNFTWWHSTDDLTVNMVSGEVDLPQDSLLVDPAYGRLIRLPTETQTPLSSWPLIGRSP